MSRRTTALAAGLTCLLVAAAFGAALHARQRSQVPGTIRSRIVMVPVDVRVLDRNGRPVTDLTKDDFVVFEDEVRQEIAHFSAHELAPRPTPPGSLPAMRRAAGATIEAPDSRTFLIVLGRGRLQHPSRGIDAMMRFVRERLLPQDHVAVLAWNRATDFTTDHGRIAGMLERLARDHEKVEAKLAHRDSGGLEALYGSQEIPPAIQAQIDDVFGAPGNPRYRRLPPGRVTDSGAIAVDTERSADAIRRTEDERRAADALQTAEALEGRLGGLRDAVDQAALFDNVSLDEYMAVNARSMGDLETLYSGIEYLRHLDGEKHIVFLSERGLFLPRLENDESLAALANDARVVVDTIHTGGIPGGPRPPTVGEMMLTAQPGAPSRGTPVVGIPAPLNNQETFSVRSLRNFSALTGGLASSNAYADRAASRLDASTRFQYLLGYSPSNGDWDGGYRRIRVEVNRPDVTVGFRHGYYANEQLVPYDRRKFMTYSRIAAAGYYDEELHDIRTALRVSTTGAEAGPGEVVADLSIDISRVAFTDVDGLRTASLEVAIFCGDESEDLVGQLWQTVALKLEDETYRNALRDGFAHQATVAVAARPRFVKAVVYDHLADVVGSATANVR